MPPTSASSTIPGPTDEFFRGFDEDFDRDAPVRPDEASDVGEPSQIWFNGKFVSIQAYQQSNSLLYPALGTDTQQINLSGVNTSEHQRIAQPHARSPAQESWSIPGTSHKTNDSCGDAIGHIACSFDSRHWSRVLVEHCNRVECPECWVYWGKQQSKRLADKLRGYIADAWENLEGFEWHKSNSQNLRHWIFSPPQDLITPEMSYDKIKDIGKKFVLKSGVTGGVMVFHPFRIWEKLHLPLIKNQRLVRLSTEEKEKKFWQCARDDVLNLGGWREYCYWSPHFHVIGFGYVKDSRELYKETGWVYKLIRNIPVQKVRTPQGIDDTIQRTCFYILSHAAYQWLKKIPVWFGCCTPRNLRKRGDPVPSEFDGMKLTCPKCAAKIVEYQDNNGEVGEKKLTEGGEEIYHTIHDVIQRYEIVTEEEKNATKLYTNHKHTLQHL